MLKLYSAQVCPYAQRTRALLTHLEEPFELIEVDLGNRDPELFRRSPTGKVPFLIDGDLELYESSVINEYLAEKLGWRQAFSDDVRLRARQRLAISRWDESVNPAFYKSLKVGRRDEIDSRRLEKELDQLALTAEQTGPPENLLGFQVATFWARMSWLREHAPIVQLFDARPALFEWLSRAAAQPAIQETLPDRESTIRLYEERFVEE